VTPRRVSIATLCVVVAVVAADCAWWRHITVEPGSLLGFRGPALDMGALPMASALIIGLAHVRSGQGRISRTTVGLLIGGCAGLILYLAYNYALFYLPQWMVMASMRPIYYVQELGPARAIPYYLYLADAVYYTAIECLVALPVALIHIRLTKPRLSPAAGPIEEPR